MVGLLFTLLLAVQDPAVQIQVSADQVTQGEALTVTVDVTGQDRDLVDFAEQPQFDGFSIQSITRNSVVRYDGGVGRRTTTWEISLRAVSPGTWAVGGVRVMVGDDVLASTPVMVTVDESGGTGGDELPAHLLALVDGAPGPDGSDQVFVSVVPSADSLVLGAQLDLLVVAWFPRDVRTRLRTRPTLTPPELTGAWTYAQTAALGVLSSRRVGGRDYDMFVHHQVVFPLTPGPFAVGPASVSYNLPVRTSILSREIPQEVQSRPVEVAVMPAPALPDGGVPMAAGNLTLRLDVDTAGFADGEAATVAAVLEGRGNVSMWPEPRFNWPAGLRVYPGQSDIELAGDSGVVAGRKRFRYLVIADSAGAYSLPANTVRYFDLDDNQMAAATFPAVRLVSRVASDNSVQVDQRGLMVASGPPRSSGLVRGLPWWSWVLIGLVPPLAFVAVRLEGSRVRRKEAARTAVKHRGELVELDEELRNVLQQLVPDPAAQYGERLLSALQAAGVEQPVAAHAPHVRERLQSAVYGPEGVADAAELAEEVRELLNALPRGRSTRGAVLGRTAAVLALALALAWPGGVDAQGVTPEQLYRAGGHRQAADSFALRASSSPNDPAHWANLGFALMGAGDDAGARAALVRAARIAPRNADITGALTGTGAVDPTTGALLRVYPVTPAEALLVAVALWLVVWGYALVRKQRPAWIPLAAVVIALAYAGFVQRHYTRAVAVVTVPNTTLLTAPFPGAQGSTEVRAGAAVELIDDNGAWMLVRRGNASGWILAEHISPV